MTYSRGLLGLAAMLATIVAVPTTAHGQQPATQSQEQHDHEHQAAGETKAGAAATARPGMMSPDMMKMMSDMKARDARIEALVQKMNATKGAEKTEAIAQLLTALVEECHAMRSSMMGMMNMMGPMGGHGPAEHDKPEH